MFYVKGIDITNDKQMFNFLKEHYEYYTMNSWNGLVSIANKVKLHSLGLSGNWCVAYHLLNCGEYATILDMISNWEFEHPTYKIGSNGRSEGYLVLYEDNSRGNILPESILDCDSYEDYKLYCKEYCGSLKANRDELVMYTKLVQDFDKLCDDIRDFCDELSNLKFEVIEMEKSVDRFNYEYSDDLEVLGFAQLVCSDEGKVDVSEIITIKSLYEAFLSIADREDTGYTLRLEDNKLVYYEL
jgi:hypothetical protein